MVTKRKVNNEHSKKTFNKNTKLNFNSPKPVACSHPDTIIDIVDKTFLEINQQNKVQA